MEVNRYNGGVKSEINYVISTKESDKDKHLERAPSEEPCTSVAVSYECTRTVYWLGDETNIISATPWKCVVTGYSQGSDTDCSNGGDGPSSYTTNDEVLEEALDQVFNNLTNQCGYDIFEELRKGIYKFDPNKHDVPISTPIGDFNLSKKILFLFSESYKTHYTIKNDDLANKNASTDRSTNTTTIDNSYLANATKLSIARTMIHEQVHAYINNVRSWNDGFKDKSLYEKLKAFAEFSGITDIKKFHHEFMGGFVDGIALSLADWDFENGNTLLDKSYYMSMAYAGLSYVSKDGQGNPILDSNGNKIYLDTDSFKVLVPNLTDRNNIKIIISNETTGNKNAKSTKCPKDPN